ncbi:TetR/AcrR family transcriptional regulator [uncultured Meiothermus sp.]|jgi:AcrR family transcriptional regulator|uniref:TetR/AcrR family transcriptional regulator n=1 Tax=uncultured Meiothermus sp. TaxID=157471 RepID=UPI00260931B2|nr:TetR/AcrR family transcriptional regulator [uncultured Meiothermus sp.]
MNTKTRILDTALELFNQQGSHAVTTNHIAEAMQISPGNLYYHFKNKEEIIRGLFARLDTTWDEVFSPGVEHPLTLSDLERLVQTNYEVMWRYRFFYREWMALLPKDPLLASQYQKVRKRGFEGFKELFKGFVVAGILQPTEAKNLHQLTQICWILSDFWLPFVELGGESIQSRHLQQGVCLMRQVLKPHLKEES